MTVEVNAVLTARRLCEPTRPAPGAVCRPLADDDDWAQAVWLRLACYDRGEDLDYRLFVEQQVREARELCRRGHGAWFGAFVSGQMRSVRVRRLHRRFRRAQVPKRRDRSRLPAPRAGQPRRLRNGPLRADQARCPDLGHRRRPRRRGHRRLPVAGLRRRRTPSPTAATVVTVSRVPGNRARLVRFVRVRRYCRRGP